MAISPGTHFGGYEVVAPLGAGGMGEVYRARDPRLGRDVAIKVLAGAFTTDPDRLARFAREARALATLNHPNVATIHGVEEVGGVRAIVMELVEGETLADLLARGSRLPVAKAIDIALQIADALDAAHERGVIHRDLKPANVRITSTGVVKVLDFGLAKIVAPASEQPAEDTDGTAGTTTVAGALDPTVHGVVLGTAPYMSPEQARGEPVDKRTDIWAFGCVLFEMLAGRRAFRGASTLDVLAAIIEREPEWQALGASTPAPVLRTLRRCLEKDPRRRLRTSVMPAPSSRRGSRPLRRCGRPDGELGS